MRKQKGGDIPTTLAVGVTTGAVATAAQMASTELQTPTGAHTFLAKEITRAKQAMQIANIQPE